MNALEEVKENFVVRHSIPHSLGGVGNYKDCATRHLGIDLRREEYLFP
jgi:hypothetical protein